MGLQFLLRHYSRFRRVFKVAKKTFKRSEALSFLGQFVRPNELVFDVGANVGDYSSLCLELGARVVAIEPQKACVSSLMSRFGRNANFVVESIALGDHRGAGLLYLSDVRSPISSMSTDWIRAVKNSGRFKHFEWRQSQEVRLVCLDDVIEKYGVPSFCKIDVEGYDYEVLCGLSKPLEKLSFEYHIEFVSRLESCVDRLEKLGSYKFNYTIGDQTKLNKTSWLRSRELLNEFRGFSYRTLQGDIYACLK